MTTIGVLDSGVGGLSVLREIHRRMPTANTIYFGDQGHVPYGTRPDVEIRQFVTDISRFLLEQGVDGIVVACNAASAAGLYYLREHFPDVPFVGMEPAVKPAVEQTKSGVIGVLTTQATANGHLYQKLLTRYGDQVRIITQIAPELVRIAEENSQHSEASQAIIHDYLAPMLEQGVDKIALACTHFPFVLDRLQQIAGEKVTFIDPAPAVARQTQRIIPENNMHEQTTPVHRYFTSGNAQAFQKMLWQLIQVSAEVDSVPNLTLA